MFIRAHDEVTDEKQWRSFVRDQGFGHLAVNGIDTVPVVVPTQFVLRDDDVVLHLARPNPVFAALAASPHATLSVAGDWAYIPGSWRVSGEQDPALGIPTTYYAAVQISGAVEVIDDIEEIAALLRVQIADVEPDGGLQDPINHQKRFPAIRGVRLSIDDVRAKFKFGDNADAENRANVKRNLESRSQPGDLPAAARMTTNEG